MREESVIFFGSPWCSGEIRARQVSERGSWLFDEDNMREGDIVVFVKSYPDQEFIDKARNNNISIYVDIVDCYGMIPFLKDTPEVTVITMSRVAELHLRSKLKNHIVFIPEHHCNFEDEFNEDREIKRVGYVGYSCNFQLDIDHVTNSLSKFGLEFVMLTEFSKREEIIDFYKSIDIQLAFRLPGTIHMLVSQLKNPLKLANAGSFGIPTICFPELSYVDEWDGYFLPIGSTDGMIYWIDELLNDTDTYLAFRRAVRQRSKYYHIDNVIQMYKNVFFGKGYNTYDESRRSINSLQLSSS